MSEQENCLEHLIRDKFANSGTLDQLETQYILLPY